ncbi:MAG TPA: NADP-dependent oxidoreductase [Candidatus Saccharimonadales bacterium]|jgi:NADPH:quinone reductase-like Zn-dependent oxidoreductase|nr:NADP-dependent oxidoreductase [Candidatus Saccharimonadales bacterium]
MKAILSESYGGPEVLRVEDVPLPKIGPNGVLVRVCAASVNPIDWKLRRGHFQLLLNYVFPVIWGADCSGEVVETGAAVTLFKPGDQVYGFKDGSVGKTYRGTYAEYVAVPEKSLSKKPANLSHEQAAAVPLAALTAWQALLQDGKLKPGQRVLVHAAAGGVGIFAVQIAKAFGAHVAATAGSHNQQFLHDLGADVTIDYQRERFAERISAYDVVLDGVGNSVWPDSLKVLKFGGRLVALVAPVPQRSKTKLAFLGGIAVRLLAAKLGARLRGRSLALTRTKPRGGDLEKISALIEAGKVRPVIEKIFPMEQMAEAHRLSETGHVRGKIVVKIGG